MTITPPPSASVATPVFQPIVSGDALAAEAHAALLAGATNFWERAWLARRLGELGGGSA